MTRAEILALADRLTDYQPTLSVEQVLCDRDAVDEAVACLSAIAEGMKDDA